MTIVIAVDTHTVRKDGLPLMVISFV